MSDTLELQTLLNNTPTDGTLQLTANRTYVITQAGSAAFGVQAMRGRGIRIEGNGAKLLRKGSNGAWSTLMVSGPGSMVRNLDVICEPNIVPAEHAHGVFWAGAGGVLDRVTATGLPGDGLYLYTGADNVRLLDCTSQDNGRNGLTLGGAVDTVLVVGGVYSNSRAQQIDVEPGNGNLVDYLTLLGVHIAAGASNDYVLTLGDHGLTHRVINCTIDGGIYVVWGHGVRIMDCSGVNTTDKASLTVQYATRDVLVDNFSTVSTRSKRGIWIASTGPDNSPIGVRISNSIIGTEAIGAPPIEISGALTVEVDSCSLNGCGVSAVGRGGVMVRATNVLEVMQSVAIRQTMIHGCGDYGVVVGGNYELIGGVPVHSSLAYFEVTDCVFTGSHADMIMDGTVSKLLVGRNVMAAGMVSGVPMTPVSRVNL